MLVALLLLLELRQVLHDDFKTTLIVCGSLKLLIQQISMVVVVVATIQLLSLLFHVGYFLQGGVNIIYRAPLSIVRVAVVGYNGSFHGKLDDTTTTRRQRKSEKGSSSSYYLIENDPLTRTIECRL